MTRDYKRKSRKSSRGKRARERRRVWPWFLFGLVAGVISSVVVLTQDLEFGDVGVALERLTAGDSREPRVAGGSAPTDTRSKPRFEFYTMLPEMEVAIPEEELDPAPAEPPSSSSSSRSSRPSSSPKSPSSRAATPPARGAYILQVGSFRARGEAERLKAELALLGVRSAVQSVVIDGKNTWHRVRVGPYTDLKALNNDRVRLREHRHDALVLRIRSDG